MSLQIQGLYHHAQFQLVCLNTAELSEFRHYALTSSFPYYSFCRADGCRFIKERQEKELLSLENVQGGDCTSISKLQFPTEEVGESILQKDSKQLVKVQMK